MMMMMMVFMIMFIKYINPTCRQARGIINKDEALRKNKFDPYDDISVHII